MERKHHFPQRGELYARALAQMSTQRWLDLDEQCSIDGYKSSASLILLHPEWYGGNSLMANRCPVRGDRRYAMLYPPAGTACGSLELWGYHCPLSGHRLQPDHRFPFALGGPTTPTNAIWLCAPHNAAKSADWHLEDRQPADIPWFLPTLDVIRNLLHTADTKQD